jgi:hypothetical protein
MRAILRLAKRGASCQHRPIAQSQDPLELDAEEMRRIGYRTVDALVEWLTDDSRPPLQRASPKEMRNRLDGAAPAAPREILTGIAARKRESSS